MLKLSEKVLFVVVTFSILAVLAASSALRQSSLVLWTMPWLLEKLCAVEVELAGAGPRVECVPISTLMQRRVIVCWVQRRSVFILRCVVDPTECYERYIRLAH